MVDEHRHEQQRDGQSPLPMPSPMPLIAPGPNDAAATISSTAATMTPRWKKKPAVTWSASERPFPKANEAYPALGALATASSDVSDPTAFGASRKLRGTVINDGPHHGE